MVNGLNFHTVQHERSETFSKSHSRFKNERITVKITYQSNAHIFWAISEVAYLNRKFYIQSGCQTLCDKSGSE
jgi:hypothetical protein